MRHCRFARLAFGLVMGLATLGTLPGCGSSGSGDENYSQKFEPPPAEAKTVVDPPDKGEEQNPRDRM
jgi:hypothetical protein